MLKRISRVQSMALALSCLIPLSLSAPAMAACYWFNTSATVCTFEPDGSCIGETTWYTDVFCTGGFTGDSGYLPYWPAGGSPGGGGKIGHPKGNPLLAGTALERKLSAGKNVALTKLQDPQCAAIKDQFSEYGFTTSRDVRNQVLAMTWREWDTHETCQNGAAAFVDIGNTFPVVYLCNLFANMGDNQAANRVIHEALHTLGLGEDPPSDDQINGKIQQACGLPAG